MIGSIDPRVSRATAAGGRGVGVRAGRDHRRRWKLRRPALSRRRPAACGAAGEGAAALQPGRPLSGRYAVTRKDRHHLAQGHPLLCARAARPDRLDRGADLPRGRPARRPLRARRRDRGPRQGRALPRRAAGRDHRAAPARAGLLRPGRVPAAAYRSIEELEGFFEHLCREVHDPALRGGRRTASLGAEPVASELRRAPCTPRRPPRLSRRPARAHRRGRRRSSARSACCIPASTPTC